MAGLNFLDANVWMALIWDRHTHAGVARQWFEQGDDGEFFYCSFTQIAVLRLLTTESVMGRDTQTMVGAWNLWDRAVADGRISSIGEPAGLEAEFRARSRLPSRSPKVWADAYLLAFASAAGLRLVTFDRSLRSRGAHVLVL
jgi:toxin-antitoxin system PIN domain toxin